MADRETVMSWLEGLTQDDWRAYHSDSEVQNIAIETVSLLKQQEDRIRFLTRAIEQMPKPTKLLDVYGNGYAKIVRCKNCKFCEYPDAEKEWCKKGHLHGNAKTWFCADGERSVECE